jgi:glycosyltransferase involved in cell wall biosynthesis
MAENLSSQTYQNFEWLIVDDHKEDRSKIAQKYAKKYNLDIKYVRNVKHKRLYGLSTANNTAINHATGDLFVALQDFIILQPTALEELARESERHPGDLIAPVDVYYESKVKPDTKNVEDWFNGETDIVGKYLRKNVRIQGQGLRKTTNPYDFELNIGAIPMSTLKELNGWWEFMGDALGYDNTEIAYRAMKLGYNIFIDEWNVAICIDHWGVVGNKESGKNRTRLLNDPRYHWLLTKTEAGELPIKRDPKLDDLISLDYEIPKEVTDDECKEWIRENYKKVAEGWK